MDLEVLREYVKVGEIWNKKRKKEKEMKKKCVER